MLIRIKYDLLFTSTMQSMTQDIDFETGMTAITGPNESGKSMVLEMIRYCLFGTKVLRGGSKSFKKIDTELSFKVNDIVYLVKRFTRTQDELYRNGELFVTGTRPVNEAVIEILGYGLDIFDTTNACLQNKVEELSSKTPAERQKMIDRVIGLEAIDTLIKTLTGELSEDRKVLSVLEGALHELEAPEQPEGYREIEDHEIPDLKAAVKALGEAEAFLTTEMTEPVEPEDSYPDDNLDDLLAQMENYNVISDQIDTLQRIPEVELDETIDTDFDNRLRVIELIKQKVEKPQYSRPQVVAFRNQNLDHGNYLHGLGLKDRIKDLKSDHLTCDDCFAKVYPNKEKIADLENQYAETIQEEVKPAELTNTECLAVDLAWDKYYAQPEESMTLEPNDDNVHQVEADRKAVEAADIYEKAMWSLGELVPTLPEDVTDKVTAKRDYLSKMEAISGVKQQYDDWVKTKAEKQTYVSANSHYREKLSQLEAQHSVFFQYKVHNDMYLKQKEANDDTQRQIDEMLNKIKMTENARKGLKDLKPRVKMYLMPSLNKVSSLLLQEMTAGKRNHISISEKFEITVDGQAIEELSGSAKAVANLAIRIALGTVLTNKVFSVFLADEVDSSMDKDRAEYTAQCLRNINKKVQQIILVSHKRPEADNIIELESQC